MAWFAALGTLLSAMSTVKQGSQAAAAGEQDALNDERSAAQESSAALRDEESQRRSNRMLQGRQRAAIAASGGGYGGSNALLLDQSDANAELDALNIRYGGRLRSMGLLSRAAVDRSAGANAQSQSRLLAGAQLLRGASDSYTNYRLKVPKG